MKTQDVINPESPSEKPKTREETVAPVILPEMWKPVADRMKVVFEPFSSAPPTAEKGTDLNQALTGVGEKHANLRGIVLLSDGDWNTGQSPDLPRPHCESRTSRYLLWESAAKSDFRIWNLLHRMLQRSESSISRCAFRFELSVGWRLTKTSKCR